MTTMESVLEERGLRYSEKDFWYNPIIEKEVVRFDWENPKYKGHFKTVKGIKHFDDFIMGELRYLAEKNNISLLNAKQCV